MNDSVGDFTKYDPFFIGYDEVWKRLNLAAGQAMNVVTYPPYNIRKIEENRYVLELAVAGFARTDIDIDIAAGVLKIVGKINRVDKESVFLHRGIAERAFTRTFNLADNVKVQNAEMINGMLRVWLEAVLPEHKKPKKIHIGDGSHIGDNPHYLSTQLLSE